MSIQTARLVDPRFCGAYRSRQQCRVAIGRPIPACTGEMLRSPSAFDTLASGTSLIHGVSELPVNADKRVTGHPRLRGGNQRLKDWTMATKGSSPPARGKHAFTIPCPRFIPPPTRGKLRFDGVACRDRGFIPACAGETGTAMKLIDARRVYPRLSGGGASLFRLRNNPTEVYPRLRGGNSIMLLGDDWPMGLSPPTRGKLRGHIASPPDLRFIPAYAGETLNRNSLIALLKSVRLANCCWRSK